MKKALACAVLAAALVFGSAGAAMAGEINGNGDSIPGAGNASSACAFSGQDGADPDENQPNFPDDDIAVRGNQKHGYHGVQNYGGLVRAGLKGEVPGPGVACRGNIPHIEP